MGRHVTKKPKEKKALPVLLIKQQVENLKWTAFNGEEYYIEVHVHCEVLTVHFERNSMRIRFTWNGKKIITNYPADEFFKRYPIED